MTVPLLPRLPRDFRPLDLRGQRVLLVGLGTFGGGLGAALHLVREGADVTIADTRNAAELTTSLASLRDLPIRYCLGQHASDAEVAAADWIVASPAVPWSAPPLRAAARMGKAVESEITLLVRLLPCRWLGITGTNGKSTTTMLAMRTLAAAGRRVEGGGNLGGSLLDRWRELKAADAVVLELSSFQLEHLGEIGLGPDVAVLTNVTHDHLDRHGTFEAYAEAKRQILTRAEIALLPRADLVAQQFGRDTRAKVVWYGEESAFQPGERGVKLRAERFATFERDGGADETVDLEPLQLRGVHNRQNLMAAAAAATFFDVPFARAATAGFAAPPLARRLNEVARVAGVLFVDDSVSTSPPAVAVALRAYSGSTHLIAGGYDKGIDPEPLLDSMVRNCRSVYLYGAVGPGLARRLEEGRHRAARPDFQHAVFPDLRAAFQAAAAAASAGETILYSPGYASYDQFRNFTERGDLFCALVADHAQRRA